jgi:chemotaxis signal transduction protein
MEVDERVRFVRFRGSGGERLLPLSSVVEIIPMLRLLGGEHEGNHRYCGALHFRGRVIPVFDLEDGGCAGLDNPAYFLVVARGISSERAIVAHDVDDIVEVASESCSELDIGGPQPVRIVDVEGTLLKVVDPDRLAE